MDGLCKAHSPDHTISVTRAREDDVARAENTKQNKARQREKTGKPRTR